jgi:hypothetical protein
MSLRGFVLKHCASAPSWNQIWSFGTGSNRKVFSKPHLGAFFASQKTQARRNFALSRSGPNVWPLAVTACIQSSQGVSIISMIDTLITDFGLILFR